MYLWYLFSCSKIWLRALQNTVKQFKSYAKSKICNIASQSFLSFHFKENNILNSWSKIKRLKKKLLVKVTKKFPNKNIMKQWSK